MLKPVLKCLLALELLIVASQACVTPAAPPGPALEPNAIKTAIAGTMAAAWTQTAQSKPIMESLDFTVTPSKTLSPTPFPTFTLVVARPVVYVTKSTACRAGPGQAYPAVGTLKPGEFAQVVGRSEDGKYWIIRLPGNPDKTCWLWGQYAVVTGVAGILRVMTPPPTPKPTRTPTRIRPTRTPTETPAPPPIVISTGTPTPTATQGVPSFTVSYSNVESCNAVNNWWVDVTLTNNGQATFQSLSFVLQDITTGGPPLTLNSDGFTEKNGCNEATVSTLPPGIAHNVSSHFLTYDPTQPGPHAMSATIFLCTGPGQTGTCLPQSINFTTP